MIEITIPFTSIFIAFMWIAGGFVVIGLNALMFYGLYEKDYQTASPVNLILVIILDVIVTGVLLDTMGFIEVILI